MQLRSAVPRILGMYFPRLFPLCAHEQDGVGGVWTQHDKSPHDKAECDRLLGQSFKVVDGQVDINPISYFLTRWK